MAFIIFSDHSPLLPMLHTCTVGCTARTKTWISDFQLYPVKCFFFQYSDHGKLPPIPPKPVDIQKKLSVIVPQTQKSPPNACLIKKLALNIVTTFGSLWGGGRFPGALCGQWSIVIKVGRSISMFLFLRDTLMYCLKHIKNTFEGCGTLSIVKVPISK